MVEMSQPGLVAAKNFPNRRVAPRPVFSLSNGKRETCGRFHIRIFFFFAIFDFLKFIDMGRES